MISLFVLNFHDDLEVLRKLGQDKYSDIWANRGDCFYTLLEKMKTAFLRGNSGVPLVPSARARCFQHVQNCFQKVGYEFQALLVVKVHHTLIQTMTQENAFVHLGFDEERIRTILRPDCFTHGEALEMLLAVAVDQLFKARVPSFEEVQSRSSTPLDPELAKGLMRNYTSYRMCMDAAVDFLGGYTRAMTSFINSLQNPATEQVMEAWANFYASADRFAESGFAKSLQEALRYHVALQTLPKRAYVKRVDANEEPHPLEPLLKRN